MLCWAAEILAIVCVFGTGTTANRAHQQRKTRRKHGEERKKRKSRNHAAKQRKPTPAEKHASGAGLSWGFSAAARTCSSLALACFQLPFWSVAFVFRLLGGGQQFHRRGSRELKRGLILSSSSSSSLLSRAGYRNPLEQGISYEDMYMPTLDGITIHGWLLKSPDAGKVCAVPVAPCSSQAVWFGRVVLRLVVRVQDVLATYVFRWEDD